MAALHLMVGLPCSGKTKTARYLERKYNALLVSLDIMHPNLFGIVSKDPDKDREVIETLLWNRASRVLSLGVDVILDYGFLRKADREKYRARANELGVGCKIHFMDVPVPKLYKLLEKRNRKVSNAAVIISREDMDKCVNIFQPPGAEELGLA